MSDVVGDPEMAQTDNNCVIHTELVELTGTDET